MFKSVTDARLLISLISTVCFYSMVYAAELTRSVDEETNLAGWKITDAGLELELIQRLPDQTQGFFQARGFSKEIASEIASSCVFQTIARNVSAKATDDAISISLRDWRVSVAGKIKTIKLKETWDGQWSKEQITIASRLAFRWATFPTQQTFEPGGDYNWGMTSFDLPPGTIFDLHIFWVQGSQQKDLWIKSIQCPQVNQ
jgi:hypothetical protein